jgi:hypothetical protein
LNHHFRDHLQDLTLTETIRKEPKCDRSVALYGFLRGCNLRLGQRVHLAGVGDFSVVSLEQFPDPCPLPDTIKKRGLNEQERLIHAPMSNVGGLLYDKDATYIDIPDWKVQYSNMGTEVPKHLQEVCADLFCYNLSIFMPSKAGGAERCSDCWCPALLVAPGRVQISQVHLCIAGCVCWLAALL